MSEILKVSLGNRSCGKNAAFSCVVGILVLGLLGSIGRAEVSEKWTHDLNAPVFASPRLGDVDGDGISEVLVSSLAGDIFILDQEGAPLSGWPQKTTLLQRVSPSLGDLDSDGSAEIIVGDDSGKLHAWESDGSIVTGFPVQLEGTIKSVARVCDFDGDGSPEILVHAGSSRLYALNSRGESLPGWPVDLGGEKDQFGSWTIASTPLLVDLEGDGVLEVAVGTTGNQVRVYSLDGSLVEGWPAETEDWVYGSLVAVDLDNEGSMELVAGGGDGLLYAWRADGTSFPGFPIELGAPVVGSVAIGDFGEASLGVVIAAADLEGNVFCFSDRGELLDGWPKAVGSGIVASPVLVDVDADGVSDILVPSRDGSLYAWNLDGSKIDTGILESEDWIEATPVAGDLDGDGLIEFVYASYDGSVYAVDLESKADAGSLLYPGFLGENDASEAKRDLDRDGLPDAYEWLLFANLSQDGESDFDNDGQSNLEEWVCGTDPADAQDFLAVALVCRRDAGKAEVGLQWSGRVDRRYQIYASASIKAGEEDWYPISDDGEIQVTDDISHSWYDVGSRGCEQRFYRVAVALR